MKAKLRNIKVFLFGWQAYANALLAICAGMLIVSLAYAAAPGKTPDLSAGTPLDKAAYGGQLDKVEYFVRMGALPNGVDKNSDTPLDFAVQSGHLAVARYLFAHLKPKYLGDACLGHAIISDYTATVRFLLAHGIHLPDSVDDEYPIGFVYLNDAQSPVTGSPLELAVTTNDPDLVKILIDHGAKVDESEFDKAVSSKDVIVAKLLLNNGIDANKAMTDAYDNQNLWSPITHFFVLNDGMDATTVLKSFADAMIGWVLDNDDLPACRSQIEFMLSHGANVNVKLQGSTSSILGWAVSTASGYNATPDDWAFVNFLLAHGADPNAGNPSVFARFVANNYGHHLGVMKEMLDHHANPNAVSDDGKPLLFEFLNGDNVGHAHQLDPASLLLTHGANANAIDPTNGESLFQETAYAITKDDWINLRHRGIDFLLMLLRHGANLKQNDAQLSSLFADVISLDAYQLGCDGCSTTERAKFNRDFSVLIDSMLQHGANPNEVDAAGSSVLDVATNQCLSADTIKLLLQHGANPNIADPKSYEGDTGTTPLLNVINCAQGVQMVKDLIAHGADVDQPDKDGTTPLCRAIENPPGARAHVSIVKSLIGAGADVNERCAYYYRYSNYKPFAHVARGRPLDAAIEDDHSTTAAYLRAHGARR